MPRAKMTVDPVVSDFIKENIRRKTLADIGRHLGISSSAVINIVRHLNDTEKTKMKVIRDVSKQWSSVVKYEPSKLKRPPAEYSNKSREDYVDYWLNYPATK